MNEEDLKFLTQEPDYKMHFKENKNLQMLCVGLMENNLEQIVKLNNSTQQILHYLKNMDFRF